MIFYKYPLILVFISACSFAADIEIGYDQGVSDLPWGTCMFSIRCQVLLLSQEVGCHIEIDEISFKRTEYGTGDSLWLEDPRVYMALTDLEQLTENYDLNYDPSTRELVYSSPQLCLGVPPEGWAQLPLDQSFCYENSRNLLIEVVYTDAQVEFQTCSWYGTGDRVLWHSDPQAGTGTLLQSLPHMMLSGKLELRQSTFAQIKSVF